MSMQAFLANLLDPFDVYARGKRKDAVALNSGAQKMTTRRSLGRTAAIVGLVGALGAFGPVGSSMAAGRTVATSPGVALLKSYEGEWRGQGTLLSTNERPRPVQCRLTLTPGNAGKVNYSGRCGLDGSELAISGTLAYINASRRYEAIMTSNTPFTGVAIGLKQPDGIVFALRDGDATKPAHMTIRAGIALTAKRIVVEFMVEDLATGQAARASVPFSRSTV